ncbi:unnamed protein product, partial [Choristocarpus tenellus]
MRRMSEYVPPTLSPADLKAPLPEKYSVGKNLQLQAVLFEYGLLSRTFAEKGRPDDVLIRGNIKGPHTTPSHRAIPSSPRSEATGDQINLVAEMTGLIGKARDTMDIPSGRFMDVGRTLIDTLKNSVGHDEKESQPKEILKSATHRCKDPENTHQMDVKAKYMAKFLKKTGGRTRLPADPSGDADLLKAARISVDAAAPPPAAWMLREGAGELLLYLAARSMRLGVIAGPNTTQEEFSRFVVQLREQDVGLKTVITPEEVEAKGLESCLHIASQSLGAKGGGVMVVSSDDPILGAASVVGMHTARYHQLNTRRGSVIATSVVRDIDEV